MAELFHSILFLPLGLSTVHIAWYTFSPVFVVLLALEQLFVRITGGLPQDHQVLYTVYSGKRQQLYTLCEDKFHLSIMEHRSFLIFAQITERFIFQFFHSFHELCKIITSFERLVPLNWFFFYWIFCLLNSRTIPVNILLLLFLLRQFFLLRCSFFQIYSMGKSA